MHSFGTNLTHFEMKSHSSEAADLERSCMLHVCVFIITQMVYSLYIVFSHTTAFEDSAIFDSSYLTVVSCPCGFVVDPVLINHVMLLKITGYSLFIT